MKSKSFNRKKMTSLTNGTLLTSCLDVEEFIFITLKNSIYSLISGYQACKKRESMLLKDLNIKRNTLNRAKEKLENSIEHIVIRENFLNRTPMIQALRSTIDKSDLG